MATTSCGAPPMTATTSSGAPRPTATTSCGAPRRRRQHRVGHVADGDNIVWGTDDGANLTWATSADGSPVLVGSLNALTDEEVFALLGQAPIADSSMIMMMEDETIVVTLRATGRRSCSTRRSSSMVDTDDPRGAARPADRHGRPADRRPTADRRQSRRSSRPSQRSSRRRAANHARHHPAGRQPLMEKMPYRAELDLMPVQVAVGALQPTASELTSSDWRRGLPTLSGQQVVMRELRASDAPSLFALLTTEEVSRFISPPPSTVEGFERFIAWAQRQRAAGAYACFAVTVRGFDTAIGIFQIRDIGRGFGSADWGFAIGSAFWGTGVLRGRGEAGHRLRVRHARRAAPRSARGGPERPRQCSAPEARRRRGVRAAPVVPPPGRTSRSSAVRDSRRGLARDAHGNDALADRAALIVAAPKRLSSGAACPSVPP